MVTRKHKELIKSVYWLNRIDLGHDENHHPVVTPGELAHDKKDATPRYGIPDDLSGLYVLDLGCGDGLFALEAERRNAAFVMAIDHFERPTWKILKSVTGCQVVFRVADVLDHQTLPEKQFDLVFFFGVLYHLTDPFLGLRNLKKMVNDDGYVLIETATIPSHRDPGYPALAFWNPHDGDPTNFWYPNEGGLDAMIHQVGLQKDATIHRSDQNIRLTVKASPISKPDP